MKSYLEVVSFLESLQIMPKTMPGLEKIKRALLLTDWYADIDPQKVIVVAGTNGKGSSCAVLEALLLEAQKKVGFYSSPHLISTVERIRLGGASISESDFVKVFQDCEELIKSCELSHFESLTLMAGHFFFSKKWNQNLDYIIFEVGLGGLYDATNAFPHQYSVITALGLDHTAILGNTLPEVARNKFGIVQKNNLVVHHPLPDEVLDLQNEIKEKTSSKWFAAEKANVDVIKQPSKAPQYLMTTKWGQAPVSLMGSRAVENAMTALTLFEKMGFEPRNYLQALHKINWPGRMQKINYAAVPCPVYVSGDHNPQGIQSLLHILKDFTYRQLHIVIGIGVDKEADEMLQQLVKIPQSRLHLTVTPFKGRRLIDYPTSYLEKAEIKNEDPIKILEQLKEKVSSEDLIIITGSLYLVGAVLKANLENQFAQTMVLN